jgi:hypothetical protein
MSRVLLLAVGLALLAGPADARKRRWRKKKLSPAAAKAKQAFRRGSMFFAKKDYVSALEAFQRADFLKPHFLLQCNMARCYQRMGKMVESAEHYRKCLKRGAAKRRRMARRVRRALKRVEKKITWVEVTSPGKGGTVFINGLEKGPAPLKVGLNPGTTVIEVRREGAKPAGGTITTSGGETQVLELIPKEPKKVAMAPVAPPKPRPPPPPRKERRGLHQAWFWTAAAVTLGTLAAASVVGYTALQKKNDYEDDPTRQGYNDAKDRRLVANLLWGATLAAAGATTTVFFFTDFDFGKRRERRDRGDDDEVVLGVGIRGTF